MKISKVIFHIKPIPSHPWWECKKFFRLWRYKIKIQLYNVCILCDVWLKVANCILRSSNVRYPNWGTLGFQYSTFDYAADRIEKIRSKEGCFECRIFDIRLCGRSNRKNPIRQIRRFESNLRHSIRQNAHV